MLSPGVKSLFLRKELTRYMLSTEIKPKVSKNHSSTLKSEKNNFTWWAISGLSRFSSRKDVDALCRDLSPIEVEAILDKRLHKSGSWAIKLPSKVFGTDIERVLSQHPYYEMRIRRVETSQINPYTFASAYGISSRTVALRNINTNRILREHIETIFEGYELEFPNPVRILSRASSGNEYLVHFINSGEAERAAVEKRSIIIEGNKVLVTWYDV